MLFERVASTVDTDDNDDNNDNAYDKPLNNTVTTDHWWFMNKPTHVG